MQTTPDITIRELDHRSNDGIDVRLLWNFQTNLVSVAVEDEWAGESFQLTVDGVDALDAFRHPYAYVNHPQPDNARGHAHQPE